MIAIVKRGPKGKPADEPSVKEWSKQQKTIEGYSYGRPLYGK